MVLSWGAAFFARCSLRAKKLPMLARRFVLLPLLALLLLAPSGSSMMLKGVAVTEQEYYEKGGETFMCRDGSGESIPTQLVNDDYW